MEVDGVMLFRLRAIKAVITQLLEEIESSSECPAIVSGDIPEIEGADKNGDGGRRVG